MQLRSAHFSPVLAVLLASCAARGPGLLPLSDPAAIPKIDFHAHYTGEPEKLLPVLERWNMRAVLVGVIMDRAAFPRQWAGMQGLHARHPDRFVLATTFDESAFNEPDFAERVIAGLRADLDRGARAVKVWKTVGMELKDTEGRYVQIDHPRFQPIWDFLVERGIPVIAHIAEPIDAWQPLTRDSPHFGYYSTHPQYHAYQHPEIPHHSEIIAARDRWLARNPRLVVVGAHIGSLEHDVDEVARRLDAYPNFHVETAARINNLARQPSAKVRDFFLRYQDRILYGTDFGEGGLDRIDPSYALQYSYYATTDSVTLGSSSGWRREVQGLGLPREVLRKLYHDNAVRVLGL